MDRVIPDTYTPDLNAAIDRREDLASAAAARGCHADDGAPYPRRMPQLPDDVEARAWVLSTCEGRTQAQIADELGVSQGSVSRIVDRAASKIDVLVSLGWIRRDALERQMRRTIGLAARS